MPSLSIITAVRNNARLIGDALSSAVAQDYGKKELIVVDGGSTDGTMRVVRRFGSAITRVISEPDRGIYDALNKGIALATGDIVAFLHSDDQFASADAASSMVAAFRDPAVDAAYGDLLYVHRDSGSTVRTWRSGSFTNLDLMTGWMPPHPAFFMRRERYVEWGGFAPEFRIAGDYDAMLRYLVVNRARAVHVDKVVVRMRTGGISNRSLRSLALKTLEDLRAMKRNGVPRFPAIVLKPMRKLGQFRAA